MKSWMRGVCGGLLALGCTTNSQAWPGYGFETWREVTHGRPLEISTPQSGHEALIPLLTADDGSSITTREAWAAKRARILETWSRLIGEPGDLQRVPATAELGERIEAAEFTRIHLKIATDPATSIPAYLFLPRPLPSEPRPVVIALHQTVAQGKQEPAGIRMTHDLNFAEDLVRRGFVTLTYDAEGFGERIPEGETPYAGASEFFARHPNWSYFGRMNWDLRQVIDYLETVPEVDAKRIAVIGHSHGAYGGIVGAAFEPRIGAVVSSCGFTTLRADPNPERWSDSTPLLPQLGFFVQDIKQAPVDWHEMVACIAPRPFYYFGTYDDAIFPNTRNLDGLFAQARGVYRLWSTPDALRVMLTGGPHTFPIDRQAIAYAWLEDVLQLKTIK